MNFSIRLKELRQSHHLSQHELADRLGVAKSTISMYEQGKREPSFEMEEAIADYFNVNLDYLRGKEDLTTDLVDPDAHLLIEVFNELNAEQKGRLLGYARGLKDLSRD